MLQVKCPSCNQYLTASDEQAGTMVPCRHCGAWVAVPGQGTGGAEQEAPLPCPFCARSILIRAGDIGIPISCPHCSEMLRVGQDRAGRLVLLVAERDLVKRPVPWENRGELGFWKALWGTFKGVAFAPADFFGGMRHVGLRDPMLFF